MPLEQGKQPLIPVPVSRLELSQYWKTAGRTMAGRLR